MAILIFIILMALSFLTGCSSNPVIIPDLTSDNGVMLELKHRIAQSEISGVYSSSYGWLFWYIPLAVLLIFWGYRNLIKKPLDCIEEEPDSVKLQDKVDGDIKT